MLLHLQYECISPIDYILHNYKTLLYNFHRAFLFLRVNYWKTMHPIADCREQNQHREMNVLSARCGRPSARLGDRSLTTRINMWCGPRTCSTSLMYGFHHRGVRALSTQLHTNTAARSLAECTFDAPHTTPHVSSRRSFCLSANQTQRRACSTVTSLLRCF